MKDMQRTIFTFTEKQALREEFCLINNLPNPLYKGAVKTEVDGPLPPSI